MQELNIDYFESPCASIISVGINNEESIIKDKCIANVPILVINEEYSELDNLKQFFVKCDIVTVLVDLTKDYAIDILKFIARSRRANQVFVVVVSEEFSDSYIINEYKNQFFIIFSNEIPLYFHNAVKVLYSMFGLSYIGIDFCDVVAFFNSSPVVKYMNFKCNNLKDKKQLRETTSKIKTIINSAPPNKFDLFFTIQTGNVGLETIEELAKTGVNDKVGYLLWNAIFDESFNNDEFVVHMLISN